MTTWSGQPDELALHWGPETYQRLGHVVELLRTGRAADRDKAYEEFIELKRWFILEKFNLYLNALDQFRSYRGVETISEIMDKIHAERKPATNWKALQGPAIESVMLPEMETVTSAKNELHHREYTRGSEMEKRRIAYDTMTDYLNKAGRAAREILTTDYYSLFLKIIRRCK